MITAKAAVSDLAQKSAEPPKGAATLEGAEAKPEPEDEELLCTICGLRACWQK